MKNIIKKPELLCPAGSPEAFAAAIEGGADAIYVGGTAFNARMNAKNFTEEELRDSISLAHSYGVKVYITLNTLVYDTETDAMCKAAEAAYLCGADALIVADLGAATEIKKRVPIELHASTQMSGHNTDAAKYLSELGFSRMVLAREMSREDIREFVNNSPIEAEVFVHGALCVCHSGQCLFSSLVGGRSGNRGECAQPCRLPFKNRKNEYPLSLKDLSLARHVPELCDMGIASFKIEGRMKSPEYVRDVARIWRELIDSHRGADDKDMARLSEIFSRGGFTDGYYLKNIGSHMLGVRSESDKRSSRALEPFSKIDRRIPLTLSATLKEGEPMTLSAETAEKRVTVFGAIPEKALNAPLSREAVEKNLSKLGNTPYVAKSCNVQIEGELMVPISAINALRRAATEALAPENRRSVEDLIPAKENKTEKKENRGAAVTGNSAYFHFPERIPDEAKDFFNIIYLPLEKYDGSTNGVALPEVIYDSERQTVEALLEKAKKLGCQHILVGNAGHIELARATGMTVHGDLRLNVANSMTAKHLSRELDDLIAAPELSLAGLRDIRRQCGSMRAVIYGRIPLMITEKCVGKELSDCNACEGGRTALTDRRGVRFPVLKAFGHRSLIVNSVPVYMADRKNELDRNGIKAGHFIFTTESRSDAAKVIRAYRDSAPPTTDVRRIK